MHQLSLFIKLIDVKQSVSLETKLQRLRQDFQVWQKCNFHVNQKLQIS